MKTLYTWLGHSDFRASDPGSDPHRKGPLCDALLSGMCVDLKRVVILSDKSQDMTEPYIVWLKRKVDPLFQIDVRFCRLSDPSDVGQTWVALRSLLDREPVCSRVYFIGSGTPAMQLASLALARLEATSGELIQADEKNHGCRRLELPFELRLGDAPDPAEMSAVRWAGSLDLPFFPELDEEVMKRAANCDLPVLLLGETGSGKEWQARRIHAAGLRRDKPFLAINCAALPGELFESELFGSCKGSYTGATKDTTGIFEQAKDGTVLLDELGELPLAQQAKLLRALQERTVRRVGESNERPIACRFMAATHCDLWAMVREGTFREDLMYRLAAVVLELPPLRDWPGYKFQTLVDYMMRKTVEEHPGLPGRSLDNGAMKILMSHVWPGNVRELQFTLQRAAFWATGPTIDRHALQRALLPIQDVPKCMARLPWKNCVDFKLTDWLQIERERLVQAAVAESSSREEAARLLGTTPQQLSRWLKGKGREKQEEGLT